MKRLIHAVAIVLVSMVAMPMFAARQSIVDDVIRMSRAGVEEATIVEFVHKSGDRFDVTADDLIAMSDAKVSRVVMKALLDEADDRNGRDRRADVRRNDSGDRSTVIVEPYPSYGYYPYYPYYLDPYWYGPRLSLGFGFGFGHYYGGGHGGHGGGGGSHHGRH